VCGTIESVLALNAMQRISKNHDEHLNECHGKNDSVFTSTGSDPSTTRFNAKSIPRNSGLRVAVCDVNIGAVTAATLLSSYVLPHMKDACKCRCSVSQGKSYTHDDESSSSSSSSSSSNNSSDIRCGKSVDNNSKNGLGKNIDNYDDDNDDKNSNGNNITEEVTSQILNTLIDNNSRIRISTKSDERCSKNLTNKEVKKIICKKKRKCHCGGYVVLTLKLVKNAKESYIKNAVDSASVILAAAGCYDFHAVHLGANSRNERTLVCRLKTVS
jgi:hypothetical protein